jgi:hypothetical protein
MSEAKFFHDEHGKPLMVQMTTNDYGELVSRASKADEYKKLLEQVSSLLKHPAS